jgi:hypothetical protein
MIATSDATICLPNLEVTPFFSIQAELAVIGKFNHQALSCVAGTFDKISIT